MKVVNRQEAIAQALSLHPEVQRRLKELNSFLKEMELEKQRRQIQDWKEERRKAGGRINDGSYTLG